MDTLIPSIHYNNYKANFRSSPESEEVVALSSHREADCCLKENGCTQWKNINFSDDIIIESCKACFN
ncbi:NOF-FB transposable element protein [Aphis craccivora]|uniref:NOF-FB transposable element protein n=1 Tax=Aphis craccivora TaxID=307492 RepID=A0A6G0Y950_APHCR|nr:NOF-FB transposable element protein [Aphis craccivora]